MYHESTKKEYLGILSYNTGLVSVKHKSNRHHEYAQYFRLQAIKSHHPGFLEGSDENTLHSLTDLVTTLGVDRVLQNLDRSMPASRADVPKSFSAINTQFKSIATCSM